MSNNPTPPPGSDEAIERGCSCPVLDNFVKLIADCCEGLVYTNDSRVVDLHARKHLGDTPGVTVTLTALTECPSVAPGCPPRRLGAKDGSTPVQPVLTARGGARG